MIICDEFLLPITASITTTILTKCYKEILEFASPPFCQSAILPFRHFAIFFDTFYLLLLAALFLFSISSFDFQFDSHFYYRYYYSHFLFSVSVPIIIVIAIVISIVIAVRCNKSYLVGAEIFNRATKLNVSSCRYGNIIDVLCKFGFFHNHCNLK